MRTTASTVSQWLNALIFCLLIVFFAPALADAQGLPSLQGAEDAEPAPVVEATTPAAIAERAAGVAEERKALASGVANADPYRRAELAEVQERLQQIEELLQQQAQLAASVEASSRAEEGEKEVPASPFALFAMYEAQVSRETARAALGTSRAALAQAKEEFHAAEVGRRKARQEWEQADLAAKGGAKHRLVLRQLASRIAREEVNVRTLEVRAAERTRDDDRDAVGIDARIQAMRDRLAAGHGDSRAGIAALVEREGELLRTREATQRRLATADLLLSAAKKRFSQQSEPSVALLQEVEALTARRDAIGQEIALVDARIERLTSQRDVWRRWDTLLREEHAREDLDAWETAIDERIESLKQTYLQRQGRAADLGRRVDDLDERLSEVSVSSRLRPALVEEQETLRNLYQQQLAEVEELASDLRLSQRFRSDVYDRTGHTDTLEYIARGVGAAGEAWTYEITAIDDAPITVGSLVLAFVLFGVGLWFSRRGSATVGRLAEDRFKLDAGAAHALETLAFYALLVGFSLLALRAVHFPLTAFTVLGGALAIGIGFGSQNVMNNFISGLILMLERPVRARDVVEVDGSHGTIERIGARSTQIRSTDGRHIIVPNSFFLESNVVNWTLSDELARAKVTVGVIYGSPTRLVEKLIRRVVDEDDRVLSKPAPIIIFEEFGDNSLNFDVYFWVKARSPMEMRKVQSSIRFRIDDLFREHGLVIAFPQRDVHLDTVAPIEVRMVSDSGKTVPDDQSFREKS